MSEPAFCLPSQTLVCWHFCIIHPYFTDKSHTGMNFLNYLITVTKKACAWCSMFAPLPKHWYVWFLHRKPYKVPSRGGMIMQALNAESYSQSKSRNKIHTAFLLFVFSLELVSFPLAQMFIYIYIYINRYIAFCIPISLYLTLLAKRISSCYIFHMEFM